MRVVQVHNLYDRAGRRRKLAIRFIVLSLGALFIAQVVPTLADEQSRVVEIESELSPKPTQTPPSDTATILVSSDSPTATTAPLSPGPSPTKVEVKLAPSQGMAIQFPTSVSVDPRAQVVDLPRINVMGPKFLLICAIADGAILDAIMRGLPDDDSAENLYLSGDLSSRIVISGETALVVGALNSGSGIRVLGLGKRLSSTRVHFSFVATDGIARSDQLCAYTRVGNDRMLSFKPIGIGLGLKKGQVNLD